MTGSSDGRGPAYLAWLALALSLPVHAQDADSPPAEAESAPTAEDEGAQPGEPADETGTEEGDDDAVQTPEVVPVTSMAPEPPAPLEIAEAPDEDETPDEDEDEDEDDPAKRRETEAVAFDPALAATPRVPGPPDVQSRPVPWVVPNAQIQTWFTAFDQDEDPQADPGGYGDPEHDVGFNIPRARFGIAGGWKVVDFAVRFGSTRPYDSVSTAPTTSIQLVDAWGRVSVPSAGGTTRIMVGQVPIAYSRESMMSSNDLVFQERAVSTNWLAPVRDLGASVSHQYKWVSVSAGVYNGGGNLFGDVDPGVQFVGRLDVAAGGDGFRTNDERSTIAFGAGYLYNKEFSLAQHRVNVDLLARYKGLTLFAEGGMAFLSPDDDPTVLPPGVPETTRRMGGLVQLSYYKELPVGAIEPAVRFSYFDDATHLKDNGDVGILHGGMNWREPVPFVDVGAAYIHRMELQGRQTANDSFRIFFGLRYPSRKFRPLDLVNLFRRAGTKPLAAPDAE